MDIPRNTFNAALLTFTEFGPDRAIPRRERLSQRFPSLAPEAVDELLQLFPTLEEAVFDIAVAHRQGGITKQQAINDTEKIHPLLSPETAAKLWNQAMCFALKDGY